MSNFNNLRWVECDAGPHILLEKRIVANWEGTNKPRIRPMPLPLP